MKRTVKMHKKNLFKEKINKEFRLNAEACDEVSDLIMQFCDNVGSERKDALKYRLSAEECMIFWLSHGCEDARLVLDMSRFMLIPFISIELEGEAINPCSNDKGFGSFTDGILTSLDLSPEYSYDKGVNRIRFRVRKKPVGQITKLCLVMLSAIIVGMTGKIILPDSVRDALLTALIDPVYNTFFNILGCIAGPMIFLSVAWGVYGIGDASTLSKIGKKMMLQYIFTTIAACACCVAFFPALGPGLSGGGNTKGQFASVAELILGIFPSTIVEPFATGNTLQIIFMAVIIGVALLYLGRKTRSVARAIEEVNYLVQFLMEIISKLVPFVIFLVIINMIWADSIDIMTSSWKLMASIIAAFAAVAAAFFIITSIRLKVNTGTLIRKSIPTFIVALTTASSAAAFSSNVETCEEKLGIETSLIRFGIPLGMVMHKPVSAVYNLLIVFYFAERYDVSCSVGWLVVAVFISSIIAISTPPIPGGGAIAYTIIFAQMGIPSEALAVALAIDIITDFFVTSFEMLVLPMSLLNISSGLGMLDRDVLQS